MWDIFAYVGIFFSLLLASIFPAVLVGRLLKLSNPEFQDPPDGLHLMEFTRSPNLNGGVDYKGTILYIADQKTYAMAVSWDEKLAASGDNPEDSVKLNAQGDMPEELRQTILRALRFPILGMFREMKRSLPSTPETNPNSHLRLYERPPGYQEAF